MEKFEFFKITIIKNFLTDKAFSILRAIKASPRSFPKDLMKIVQENGVSIKKSQFYRYLDALKNYNIIFTRGWVKEKHLSGYSYQITEKGIRFLSILSELFE